MCKKKQFRYCPSEIDECMRDEIEDMNKYSVMTILACCCGHGKYNKTIVIRSLIPGDDRVFEIFSKKFIPRKKKFYKKDEEGYYYIPEAI